MQTAHDLLGLIADHIFEAVAFVGALLAIVVVFTQRQLKITRAKPLYRIGTVPDNIGITLERGGKGVDKKTEKKLLGEHLFYSVFLDKKEQKNSRQNFTSSISQFRLRTTAINLLSIFRFNWTILTATG